MFSEILTSSPASSLGMITLAYYSSSPSSNTTMSDLPALIYGSSQTQPMEIDEDDPNHQYSRRMRWIKKPPRVKYQVIPKII